ncbi:MAG: GTP-binding protein [Anaerolineae bacterium]|nr:GTP-binding protein [Anaerolineae bacterium]
MLENQTEPTSVYKLIVIGDDDVGKTSLLRRFIAGDMNAELPTTPAFHSKSVTVGDNLIKLLTCDMGEQKRFWEIRETYYKGAHVAALVYDVTSPSSFFNLMHWRDELQSNVPLIPTVVVGNKIDLDGVVPPDEVRGWATSLAMRHVLLSAKTGEQVEPLFQTLAELAVREQQRRVERQRVMGRLTRP